MPQLITFAVCERCLITGEGTASLIVLMQRVSAKLRPPAPKEVPANAVIPTNWCAYSLWKPLPDEEAVEFSQVIQILWPDKSEFLKRSVRFRFQDHKKHSIQVSISGFPIGQTGEVVVNMWVERDSQRIGEIHSWAIEVEHKPYDANDKELEPIG
jgi:hypothetical protein